MSVIHQVSNVSTSRLYGSLVGAAGHVDLADREVQQVPDEEQQERHAAPAHHARGERRGEVLLHRVLHGAGAAGAAPQRRPRSRRARPAATIRPTRMIQRKPSYGSIGSPRTRRWWAYSLYASWPGEGLEVAVHVGQHEQDEDDAADGHQHLQRDGRARAARSLDQAGSGGRRCHGQHATAPISAPLTTGRVRLPRLPDGHGTTQAACGAVRRYGERRGSAARPARRRRPASPGVRRARGRARRAGPGAGRRRPPRPRGRGRGGSAGS